MTTPERDHDSNLMDHEYDGIQEYDNPLPGWWSWLFILSIVFSVFYWTYYHIGVGPSLEEKYDAAVAVALEKQFASLGVLTPTNETMLNLLRENPDKIAALRGMFAKDCAQCHGTDGGGNATGPNMTDEYYINIKQPEDIINVITNGVPGKAMRAWGNKLREPQIILLATYVASLRGTNVPGGKAAEGSAIPPWSSFDTTTPDDASDPGEEGAAPGADG
jgi:cytochrome c oxidase cbb3-type subunit 3